MNWYKFILKIKPDGKAFRSILFSKILWEVLANAAQIIIDYAILTINDQVWFVNDNFDPVPWEERFEITPPENATLEERRITVKSYMLYPQSQNRLSRDYIYDTLISAGYDGIDIEYNPTGDIDGFLHVNDFADEKLTFSIGALIYNSFIISGELTATFYANAINLAMSLKPLQVAMYDKVEVLTTIALSDTLAIAIPKEVDYHFDSKFGSNGSGDGQFQTPSGIAVNNSNIYVLDKDRDDVQIFDLDGVFVSKFGSNGSGDGQFQAPSGIAVDNSNIYVSDEDRFDVQIFDLDGVFVSKFGSSGTGDGEFQLARGIAVNNYNIFVLDLGRKDVQIFDLDGVFVSKFGSSGTGDGQFTIPLGIAVNDTNIFIVDNSRVDVQIFDLDGVFVSKFGSSGSGDGQFLSPIAIAANNSNIHVLDSNRDDVQIFDLDGVFVSKFGSSGSGDGQFENPSAIATDYYNMYIADVTRDDVQIITKKEYLAVSLTTL